MSHHVIRPSVYLLVFAALIVLTIVTVIVSQMPLGEWHLPVGMLIAAVKAALVLLFFMHLWYSSRLIWIVAISGVLMLAILIFLTLNDYFMRNWPAGY